jgi:hypothetical protein
MKWLIRLLALFCFLFVLFIVISKAQVTINAPNGLTVYVDGHPVGVVTVLNFVNSNGVTVSCSVSPSNTANCNFAADTNVMLSKATDQAGTDLSWISSSNSSTAYTAAATPILIQYSRNMTARWIPDVNCGNSPSLSVGGIGPIGIKKVSNGSLIDLVTNDCRAGIPYVLRSHGNPIDSFILSVEP